ncbi:MAG TPA: ribosome biogenesis GTPase YlqF [Bacilli bacterium]
MTIQWFPGHMAKARRQMEEKLGLIDIVIELLDARIPYSSRNPMIDALLKGKPRLVVLNKSDLADPAVTKDWTDFLKSDHTGVLAIESVSGKNLAEIVPACKAKLLHKTKAQLAKGINPRNFRALIAGIPNVGKSTLINRLAGRSVAATGDRPGVTKAQQWIKIGGEMDLLDTPGILWPKFADPAVGYRLAATGAIKEEILNLEDVAFFTVRYLLERYPKLLAARYSLDALPTELTRPESIVAVMEEIGKKRGCLRSGGAIDLAKAAKTILKDLQTGKIGRISLETP